MAKKASKSAKKGSSSKRVIASKTSKKSPVRKAAVSKRPAKKVIPKKVIPKKVARTKSIPVAKVEVSDTAVLDTEVLETLPPAPTRAPTRKIFGANNSVTVVAHKAASTVAQNIDLASPVSPVSEEPVPQALRRSPEAIVAPVTPKAVVPSAPLPKVSWSALPESLPAHVRFIIGAAIKESENAAASPFPFAKFISSLPQELCGLEFALLILSLDHEMEEIGRLSCLPSDRVEFLLGNGGTNIIDKFASLCPEMYRKWRAQHAGRSISVESLIEHHLVAKVDRSYQALLAAVLLAAMGIKSPIFVSPVATLDFSKHH